MKKLCFVIMGFGKKTDHESGRTFDLDKTYKNIIQPAVLNSGYQCIRADEIQDSGLIDKSMYALLIQADLVIADISTYNPNAIYELGIRHAVRPYSTIILKEKEGKIPFDLDHSRMFTYNHLGEDIGKDESERCIKDLTTLISKISESKGVDSPLYQYITNVTPPLLPENEYQKIIEDLADKEKHIFAISDTARKYMEMTPADFNNAAVYWEKAIKIVPTEQYFIQQFALCRYKSKSPSENSALTDALRIIDKLNPTNDPETLGITGAINKNIYFVSNDVEYLNRAIENYGKAYKISGNYYNGENYALCLNMKSKIELNPDEKIYFKIEAQKTRKSIISYLENAIELDEFTDKKWMFASLAHCYHSFGDVRANDLETKFMKLALDWEIESYKAGKAKIMELIA